MRVLGVAVRIDKGAYIAGFAVLEGDVCNREYSLAAPRDVDEAVQLAELYRRAVDLINEHTPDAVALGLSEIQAQSSAAIARRAEGAILAAAGARAVPTTHWSGPKLSARAYGKRVANKIAINKLNGSLKGRTSSSAEVGHAAAAAAAHMT
jgi:Holliday junction resolvasome RuvABC endonuclease subunit